MSGKRWIPFALAAMVLAGCAHWSNRPGVPQDKVFQASALRALDRGDYRAAVDDLDRAIAIDPDYPPYYQARSQAYRQMGMDAQAEEDLRRYQALTTPAAGGAAAGTGAGADPGAAPREAAPPPAPIRDAAAERKWSAWQASMQDAFAGLEAEELSPARSAAEKAGGWADFLKRFSEENPYSDRDNALRRAAIEKIGAWRQAAEHGAEAGPLAAAGGAPFVAPTVRSRQRTALVMGNGDYQFIPPLRNPSNDAKALSRSLKQCGFDVDTVLDADRRGMLMAMRRFHDQLKQAPGGVGLFFYAGHGIQMDGENYLVPVNARVQQKFEVDLECYKMSALLASMEESGSDLNIVILDACRNNPFRGFRSQGRGLAIMDAPMGSILIYSTAPGKVAEDGDGDNSLFTAMLLKHMATPNLTVEQALKRVRFDVVQATSGQQVPWESSSLMGNFYFNEE
jgi:hypothetical protein